MKKLSNVLTDKEKQRLKQEGKELAVHLLPPLIEAIKFGFSILPNLKMWKVKYNKLDSQKQLDVMVGGYLYGVSSFVTLLILALLFGGLFYAFLFAYVGALIFVIAMLN